MNEFWNSNNWIEFENILKISVETNVNKIKSGNSDLYGYAILPGETYEVNSICSVFHNLSHLQSDKIIYKYIVDDWRNYDYETDFFEALNPIIFELNKEFRVLHPKNPDVFLMTDDEIKFIEKFHIIILSVLKELKEESELFKFRSGESFILIWISDSNSDIIFQSVEELNSKEIVNKFNVEANDWFRR
jgi:Domain of unknown function (DUF4303)